MPEMDIGKSCSDRQKVLPAGAFASSGSRPDGPRTTCRECAADYHRLRRAARGGAVRTRVDVPAPYEECRACRGVRPHGGWHRRATASDGLPARCTACRAVQGRRGHPKRLCGITGAERDGMVSLRTGIRAIRLSAPASACGPLSWDG
ncbi:hypothetical protein SSP531S_32870 [Streptomyces spongiicola]|uniref:Uncharacterized protein n=1 Tax=Streptomyces spongiicola TaxID=1690221 RepID=A0A388SZ75_9ACTN|nr:hypothetical protein SSP531S_32870 [Streptomyces spongiicola]